MKRVIVCAMVVFASAVVLAQDAVKVAPDHYKVIVDNAAVRILKITYAPGEKSAMHSHPDAVVIPLAASKVRFTLPDGKSEDSELPNESATFTPAGAHSPTNVGTGRVDAILVEFKTAAPGKAALPAQRAGLAMKILAEGPRAIVYRTTGDPNFQEPAGTKHDYDQVVIGLSTAQMSLALEGKSAKTTWARGDVVYIPRGTGHAAKNTGGKSVDFIIVAIK